MAAKPMKQSLDTTGLTVTKSETIVYSDKRPEWMKEGRRGSENVTHQDLTIPRLEIVQSLSPCRDKDDPAYIEGAEEGMLYNNVTRQLYSDTVLIVPVIFRKEYLVWKNRKKSGSTQGGFRGSFETKVEAEDHIKKLNAEGDKDLEAIDTHQHFCLLIDAKGGIQEIVLSMARSKMKVSKKWNSYIQMLGDDRFARVYKVSSIKDSNKDNQKFYNLRIDMAGFANQAAYAKAEKLYNDVSAGLRNIEADKDFEGTKTESHEESEF